MRQLVLSLFWLKLTFTVILLHQTSCETILLFVPGISFHNEKSVQLLAENVRIIRRTIDKSLSMYCMISVFDHTFPRTQLLKDEIAFCDISMYQEAGFADHAKILAPAILNYSNISWVFLLLDDVMLDGNTFK